MNYYVPVWSVSQQKIINVVVTADSEGEAMDNAVMFCGGETETGLVAGRPLPAPPNAYAVVVHEDSTHELVLGYIPAVLRFAHPDAMDEVTPETALSVHLDEALLAEAKVEKIFGDSPVRPRPYTTSYAGMRKPASTPVVTISERVIARFIASFKGV